MCFSSDFKLGILGGGQLGKMLLNETRKLDIFTKVLDPSDSSPCKIGSNEFVKGDITDFKTVYEFGKSVDVLTFEIEKVNVQALKKLKSEGIGVYPPPEELELIQNKAVQKKFYLENDIPTSPFSLFANKRSLIEAVKNSEIDFPFVWKSTMFGYDGKGVCIVQKESDLEALTDGECIAEDLVSVKKELSMIVAKNPSGDFKAYPLVEMEFDKESNQVEYILCPARLDRALCDKARDIAIRVSQKMNIVGLLAIEMFQTQDDEILVNEVAPRPHNSGHYSIEGSYTSQFEQHLRAILDLPLGSTESKTPAVMVNIVGKEGHEGPVYYKGMTDILKIEGITPHIYGKKQTLPFRKMGHVTVVDTDIDRAKAKAEKIKDLLEVISI
ncbi:5-(carboxyamino)imidazole ribonucleotide synthase [Ichthyobacterium seriolicida]|uniref:N5-carboxyaminoimidazole ribonucleotide synthase n=1 Tax=Ichthyobacterium seriolicida TaxID=242600 RepID=A0A1J1EAE0_9FLAO|nr:5-(carboxyamino)imidazole ribonucleotide synthase [Ichthyobacterium seriolicida]BAV94472.1 phosphoribosylaminoimidazole carboxylase ATPase subunit [Ichthyobacterium seriolicida]